MTHEFDPLEKEMAALRPVEPSAELAERIGARLEGEDAPRLQRLNSTRSVPATYWLAPAGAIAAVVLMGVVWWSMQHDAPPADSPLDLPQTTLATALDESLPSVWAFRGAADSSDSLNQLLDQHAARPSPAGTPEQTRGFGPMTMDLNSRLGGL
jgi:hypothetical protein